MKELEKNTIRETTIGGILEETARKFPTYQAVKYIEREYNRTYYDFNRDVDEIARGFMGMGLKKGDHVAVWAINEPQWLVLMFATARVGIVLVPVNTNYKKDEFKFVLEQSDSKALFVCDGLKDIDCEKIIYEICPELKECKKGHLKSKELPELKTVISFDNDYEGMYHWRDIKRFGVLVSDSEYENRKSSIKPDDIINMQYTSGTTGFPKGVMLTHRGIVNNGLFIGDCMKFTENDRLCIPVPFFHCFGMVLSIMACVTHGSTMLPLLWFTPMKVMHVVEYEKCTALNGVPTNFVDILNHRDFELYNYSTLRTGIMAGAICPMELMQDVVGRMNLRELTITYGLTEASPGCTQTTVDDSLEKRVSTIGKALPHTQIKVVDRETGKEIENGIEGEICVRGYNVMVGYYKLPDQTAETIREGWLHTGDLGSVDSEGYYKITGRIKDLIIRGGENIDPKEIEDVIRTIPKVKEVAVVAMKSRRYVEEVCAVVSLKQGIEMTTFEEKKAIVEEIKTLVSKLLARHKSPSEVVFIDDFQQYKTAKGTIQKHKIREMLPSLLGL